MGLFTGIKKLFEDPETAAIQEEQRRKCITTLKEHPKITNNLEILAMLNACSEIEDIQFGKTGILSGENPDDVFTIPNDEIIIASICSSDGLLRGKKIKLILTDVALYFKPNKFIRLADLSQYVLFTSNILVQLENAKECITIYEKSGIANRLFTDSMTASIDTIIRTIQISLCQNQKYACQDRKELFFWLSKLAKGNLLKSGLPERTELLIESLQKDKTIALECNLLLLHCYLYTCNYLDFYRILAKLPLSEAEKCSLEFNKSLESYITDLKNYTIDFPSECRNHITLSDTTYFQFEMTEDLNHTAINILNNLQKHSQEIIHFLAVRNNPYSASHDMLLTLKNKGISNEKITEILTFAMSLRNKTMLEVYNGIKNNTDFKSSWLSQIDGYGLTPLHYSLLLKNDSITKYLLKHIHQLCSTEQDIDTIEGRYYSYIGLAVLTEQWEHMDTLIRATDEIKEYVKEYRKISARMTLKQAAGNLTTGMAEKAATVATDMNPEEIANVHSFGENLKNTSDYEYQLNEIEHAAEQTYNHIKLKHYQANETLSKQESALDKLFYRLFTNTEVLEAALSAPPDRCYVTHVQKNIILYVDSNIIPKSEFTNI